MAHRVRVSLDLVRIQVASGPPAGFESSNAGLLGSSLDMATAPLASAPKEGGWKCDNCYVMNAPDAKICELHICAGSKEWQTHSLKEEEAMRGRNKSTSASKFTCED